MKYAIVMSGNKQYRVSEGDIIEVERLDGVKAEAHYAFPKVLLYVEDATRKVGQPALADVEVQATIVGEVKGIKVRVAKFKAKSRYRRVRGFRAKRTQLKIEKITAGAKSTAKVTAKAKAEK